MNPKKLFLLIGPALAVASVIGCVITTPIPESTPTSTSAPALPLSTETPTSLPPTETPTSLPPTATPSATPPSAGTLIPSACDTPISGARAGGWTSRPSVTSPDGTHIAFSDNSVAGNAQLRIANADGSGQIALNAPLGGEPLGDPFWSPNSPLLAFSNLYLSQPGGGEIYVVNVDGSGLIHVASYVGYHDTLAWSPDGGEIAFTSGDVIGEGSSTQVTNYRIYVVNTDGLNPPQAVADGCDPIWLP